MSSFAILNSRKRAVIALIHAAAFLGLAIRDFAVSSRLSGILYGSDGKVRSAVFLLVYLIVTFVLSYLFTLSAWGQERLYFAFCTASAASGLVRSMVGDAAFPAGQYLRIGLLACAVMIGVALVRSYSAEMVAVAQPCPSPSEGSDS